MCMEFLFHLFIGGSNWTQQSIWNFPSNFLSALQWARVQVSIPAQQHSLISMPHDLRGNAHPYPTSQKWRCNPMAHIMYAKFRPTQHGSQTCPFLSVVNWRYAIFACKDQSMNIEFWIGQICCASRLFFQAIHFRANRMPVVAISRLLCSLTPGCDLLAHEYIETWGNDDGRAHDHTPSRNIPKKQEAQQNGPNNQCVLIGHNNGCRRVAQSPIDAHVGQCRDDSQQAKT